jgi:diguanylate cyclase (GGDEF)-like protein
VAEVEQLQAELREQAIRDPLTGLYNRRYLNETLSREIKQTTRNKKPLSIIAMDIDHFKKINDRYGHPVGDLFLIEIARLIEKHARGSDFICRSGGEEFLMVLPGVTTTIAKKRAEMIRKKCAAITVMHEGKQLQITLSLGVATHPDHGQEAEEVIIKADKALYKSKRSGRNKVTGWSE